MNQSVSVLFVKKQNTVDKLSVWNSRMFTSLWLLSKWGISLIV